MLPKLQWVDDLHLTIGDTNLLVVELNAARSTRKGLALFKWRWMIDAYEELIRSLEPANIFELGICEGGSTAFFAALARPKKLVALELDPPPNRALAWHLKTHGLTETVKPYYGVDQADSERIGEIFENEYGGDLLDLVIDDASHRLDETRSSFNVLFPRLRAGGVYVIEDWPWALDDRELVRGDLNTFCFELLMAYTALDGPIERIDIDRNMIRLRRGDAPVDRDSFDISKCYDDEARELVERLEDGGVRGTTS